MAKSPLNYEPNRPFPDEPGRSYELQPVSTREATLAVTAGFLGWALDAFDFFLVVISLPQIAAEFHVTKTVISLSVTLTLVFRPVGALIFGLLADRYGRRAPMMLNLVFYSAVEVATGFAPTLTTFMILRAMFGIGMGGEWGVGASLVMEKVPARFRGLLSGLLQEGYAFGYLLAAVAAYFMLGRFGWRPMFWLGGLPALLALFIRYFVRESEVWKKTRAESWSQLGRVIASHWRTWLFLTLLMAMMNMSSHGTQDLFPTFMKEYRKLSPQLYSKIVIVMMIGAIIGGIAFGMASDRYGRRAAMVTAFLGALCVVPFWAFSHTLGMITVGAFLMQFMIQGAWGVIPAHITELSPDTVRGFLPGFAYQCGNLIASCIDPLQSKLAETHPYPQVLAVSVAIIFSFAILVVISGPERRGILFGTDASNEG